MARRKNKGRKTHKEAQRARRPAWRLMLRKFLILTFVFSPLLVAMIYPYVMYSREERAVHAAADYLLDSGRLEPDVYMLLGLSLLAIDDQGRLEELSAKNVVETSSSLMKKSTVGLALRPELLPGAVSVPAPLPLAGATTPLRPMTRADLEFLYWLVGLSINCEQATPEERQRVISMLSVPHKDYVLAHQVFSAQIMLRLGCSEPSVLAAKNDRLVLRLAREMGDNALRTDLDFERLAMLVFAGYREPLKAQYLEPLLASQNLDGSWGEDETLVHEYGTQNLSREHATALALFALAGMISESESHGAQGG